jgi:hypothetical protein
MPPLKSEHTPIGLLIAEEVALIVSIFADAVTPVPITVVIIFICKSNVRTRLFELSAKYMVLTVSINICFGLLTVAAVASPPSPI